MVSARGPDGYGQNVAKMPPAWVWVPFIRRRQVLSICLVRDTVLSPTPGRSARALVELHLCDAVSHGPVRVASLVPA